MKDFEKKVEGRKEINKGEKRAWGKRKGELIKRKERRKGYRRASDEYKKRRDKKEEKITV